MRGIFRKAVASAFVVAASIGSAFAQTDAASQYPTRSITIITSGIGGSIDIGARLLAEQLTNALHQRVIIDNVAGDVERNKEVASAKPDGYTLLYTGENLWVAPLFDDKIGYDAFKDFAPISLMSTTPVAIAINSSLPVKSATELIAYAKANPGKLNFAGDPGSGATTLASRLFAHLAGIDVVVVPYTSVSARMSALLGNEVQVHIATAAGLTPFLTSDKVRIVAVASEQPSPFLPGVPAMGDTLPGYNPSSSNALFAPAKTPAPIVDRLNREVVAIMQQPAIRAKFAAAGLNSIGSSPEDLTKAMQSAVASMSTLVSQTK